MNMDLVEVEFLNFLYKFGVILVIKDENYVLRLFFDVIGKFVNNEEVIYDLVEEEFNDREKLFF